MLRLYVTHHRQKQSCSTKLTLKYLKILLEKLPLLLLGKSPLGNWPPWEITPWELASLGTSLLGKLFLGKMYLGNWPPWENVPWEVALGKWPLGKNLTPEYIYMNLLRGQ